jgi:hypothetical protein
MSQSWHSDIWLKIQIVKSIIHKQLWIRVKERKVFFAAKVQQAALENKAQ